MWKQQKPTAHVYMNTGNVYFGGHLPGDVDRHILLGGTGKHPKQLIQDGRQELDHHMTFHGM